MVGLFSRAWCNKFGGAGTAKTELLMSVRNDVRVLQNTSNSRRDASSRVPAPHQDKTKLRIATHALGVILAHIILFDNTDNKESRQMSF